MIHNDLHMMPPTASLALDHERRLECMDRRYRRAQQLFSLIRGFFRLGGQRAADAGIGCRRRAFTRPLSDLDTLV